MLWRGRRQSGNVVDRRGVRTGAALSGGGLIMAVIYFLLTGDPSAVINSGPTSTISESRSVNGDNSELRDFVAVVLADTEDAWHKLLPQTGVSYVEPRLVLFNGQVDSACGRADSAVGPFYCPADRVIYLDLGFFKDLEQSLGAGGDFAQAYVIAHEVGHHVQNLLGIHGQGDRSNEFSVRVELQADCLAGVWARETEGAKRVGTAEMGQAIAEAI